MSAVRRRDGGIAVLRPVAMIRVHRDKDVTLLGKLEFINNKRRLDWGGVVGVFCKVVKRSRYGS
jgi:hypothetical protein